jgi:hypothetical protein
MSRTQRSQLSLSPAVCSSFHSAALKQITSAKASPTLLSLLLLAAGHGSQKLPEGEYLVMGVLFEVNFKHVSYHSERLLLTRSLYKVRHESQLKGKREVANIWRYGIELDYLEDDLITYSMLWLCG